MLDPDTFLTFLYVTVDDYCKTLPPPRRRPGPAAALSRSEVVTLALFGQWARFGGERGFYRYAARHLRGAFPGLPARAQLNRRLRAEHAALVAVGHALAETLGARGGAYEALDATAVRVRNAKRGGAGWLAGAVDIGWSNRLGWYEGFHLLVSASPDGVVTGFGFGLASTKDQPLAETFFAARHAADPRLPSVGRPSGEPYVADGGFVGAALHRHWRADYGAQVICPPGRTARQPWPAALSRWHSGLRQIIETVNDALLLTFGLDAERPHALGGFQARLAARVALHNFCCWLNRHLGRPLLAFADLLGW